MAGVVLETLSWRKLIILGVSLLALLIVFFLIGGLIAPNPSNVVVVLGTNCLNKGPASNKEWFIPRGGNERCDQVDDLDDPRIQDEGFSANQIVFSFWLPHIRDDQQLDFSRWQQTMLTVLQVEIIWNEKVQVETDAKIQLDARIGYRNREDGVNDWKELASSFEERQLSCTIDPTQMKEGYAYDCDLLPFFELGSVHHDYYLINLRVPVEPYKGLNMGIGKLREITLVAIHQNGGFTQVWLSIKTVMFPMILMVLVWYWKRIQLLTRPANLLERTLFALGIAMSVLNCPLEWFTLWLDMPFMLMITDIRQGGFYAMLMSFWIIFTGEHIMDQTERNRLVLYWKHLLAVVIGCFCLLLFEICERGVQLSNPFFSIWTTDIGTKLALAFIVVGIAAACHICLLCYMIIRVFRNISVKKLAFIIVAGIAAACYFFFLCYMIFLVFRNISAKKVALPSMSSGRRIYYMGLIYRFKFLMLMTLVCAALTVTFFILSQLSEGQWKWGDEDLNLHYTSAFFTGVYGMWNVYVFGLLSLYAPSHKQYAPNPTNEDSQEEEVQLTFMSSSATEGSALQSFVAKAATD